MRNSKLVLMFAILVGSAACATTDDDPTTPAQHLVDVTRAANRSVDAMKAEGAVFTPRVMMEVVGPVEQAALAASDDLAAWRDLQPSAEYMAGENLLMRQASVEMKDLMAKLDVHVPVANADGSYSVAETCDVPTEDPIDEVPIADEPAAPIGGTATIDTRLDATFPDGDVPFWGTALCRAACATAQVACQAACASLIVPPLTPLSPGIIACMAACVTGGALCQGGCNNCKTW